MWHHLDDHPMGSSTNWMNSCHFPLACWVQAALVLRKTLATERATGAEELQATSKGTEKAWSTGSFSKKTDSTRSTETKGTAVHYGPLLIVSRCNLWLNLRQAQWWPLLRGYDWSFWWCLLWVVIFGVSFVTRFYPVLKRFDQLANSARRIGWMTRSDQRWSK